MISPKYSKVTNSSLSLSLYPDLREFDLFILAFFFCLYSFPLNLGGVFAKLEVVLSLLSSQVVSTKLYVDKFLYCFGPLTLRKKMRWVF